ncbi:MAG: NOL1/NOP2/sun family putative RNA methylase [Halothece sp.]
MIAHELLQRYHSLIEDPQAFVKCMEQPPPTCIWANPEKASPEAVAKFLQSQGVSFEPLSWYPHAFRIPNWQKPGSTLAFATGWYNIQEEISLTAVNALNPQLGDRVLDLCAAPGGKTAQIATQLRGTGMVVANEVQVPRLSSLRAMLDRLGILNVVATNYDGRVIPLSNHSFDRVLVDAPCSGEGSLRKTKTSWNQKYPDYSSRIAKTQQKLLDRALQLVKPGGTVVYSTCTFAPEENEAVIDAVLGDRGWLESAKIPEIQGMDGLRQWEGHAFREDLAHAQRYFPHFNNTGGFFVARIRRSDARLKLSAEKNQHTSPHPAPQRLPESEVFQWFCHRFGIDSKVFAHCQLWAKGKDKLWLTNASCEPPPRVFIQTLGMPVLRVEYKPTTYALQRFGPNITRNAIALEDFDAVQQFLLGKSQPLTASVEPGYVHVRYGEYHLGCGLYKSGLLRSQMPKSIRTMVGLVTAEES